MKGTLVLKTEMITILRRTSTYTSNNWSRKRIWIKNIGSKLVRNFLLIFMIRKLRSGFKMRAKFDQVMVLHSNVSHSQLVMMMKPILRIIVKSSSHRDTNVCQNTDWEFSTSSVDLFLILKPTTYCSDTERNCWAQSTHPTSRLTMDYLYHSLISSNHFTSL